MVAVKKQALVETVPLTGTVRSERSSALSPRVSGLVAVVHVDAGERVEQGQVLIELDTELAELALARARATVAEARAQLDETNRLWDEARALAASRNIPETQLRATEAEVRIREAALQRLQVEVREQQERLRRHTIVVPFDAVVSRKLTEVGEWVDTGTAVLGAQLPLLGAAAIQQPFDMITMMAFLVLLGTVVNNPILIVDQTLYNLKHEGMATHDAVKAAMETRIRPIMMSMITTVFGLSPLVFLPGAASELCRGLGAIVLFGLLFATIVALTFLPTLLVTILRWSRRHKSA